MKSSYTIAVGIVVIVLGLVLLSAATASGPLDPFSGLAILTFVTSAIGWSMVIGGVIVKLVAAGVREGKDRGALA